MRAYLVILALLSQAAGCAQPHLAPAFGVATRDALALQQPSPTRPPAPPSMALDTQEASVIAAGSLTSLSGKSEAAPEPVLLVAPQKPGAASTPLAPSVPR